MINTPARQPTGHLALVPAILLAAFLSAGCQSSASSSPPSPAEAAAIEPAAAARDHGYALLLATLNDEAAVDKVLILKNPSRPVADVLKEIGEFARTGRDNLKNLAKAPPPIAIQDQGLPAAEAATRRSISSATSKEILFGSGPELEFRLLLTQYEALKYIQHTADVTAADEPRENRKRFLTQLSKTAEPLYQRVVGQMKSPYMEKHEPRTK